MEDNKVGLKAARPNACSENEALNLVAIAIDYIFLATLMGWLMGVVTGVAVGFLGACIHFYAGRRFRLAHALSGLVPWLLWSILIDWIVILVGVIARLEFVGAKLFEQEEAVAQVLPVSLMLAAGILVVRFATTFGVRLLRKP